MKNKYTFLIIFLLFAWTAVIIYLSNCPGLLALPFLQKLNLFPQIADKSLANELEYIVRKSAHIIEYTILYLLVYLSSSRVLFKRGENRLAKALLFSLVFCFIFAISDEWHQLLVPSRDGRISDILIDTFGIFLGQILVLIGVLLKTFSNKTRY